LAAVGDHRQKDINMHREYTNVDLDADDKPLKVDVALGYLTDTHCRVTRH
jgi:hypothetical protein